MLQQSFWLLIVASYLNFRYFLHFDCSGYYNQMSIKIIVLLIVFTNLSLSIDLSSPIQQTIEIQGNLNDHITVKFPFDQVMKVKAKDGQLPDYVKIVETRFKLNTLKTMHVLNETKRTVLDELRTPFTESYTKVFHIGRSLIIYQIPNQFAIVEEHKQSFRAIKEFKFKEMKGKDTSIGVIEENFVMVLLSKDELLVFNSTFNSTQKNPFNSTEEITIKKVFRNNNTLFMAVVGSQLYLLTIQDGKIALKSKENLSYQGKAITIVAFQRGKTFGNSQQIWMLDEDQGFFLMVLAHELKIENRPTLVEKEKGCYQLDIRTKNHSFEVLLTCRESELSTFKIFHYDNDNKKYPFFRKKIEPYIERCMSQKFMFFQDYIFSMEDGSVDVFIPDKQNDTKTIFRKYWVEMTELSSYFVLENIQKDRVFIFGIHNGTVFIKELLQESFSLIVSSAEPVETTTVFEISYLCLKGNSTLKEPCQATIELKTSIHGNIVSYVKYKSINIGIVFVLFTVLFAVFLLCRYKYGSLHDQARREFKELTSPREASR